MVGVAVLNIENLIDLGNFKLETQLSSCTEKIRSMDLSYQKNPVRVCVAGAKHKITSRPLLYRDSQINLINSSGNRCRFNIDIIEKAQTSNPLTGASDFFSRKY